ncbi:MAG: hypothetical protein Q7W45_10260 [Bacteroidota bacterium]|nr:hypothetical protein [Bacteroidota bacterium]MDP3146295.1 hypothetical protein [Bacteroidota bacterium]MDP3556401.1 hypothetical protein [Bacteroidota bacterium]
MYKLLVIALLFVSFTVSGQKKSKTTKGKTKVAQVDSTATELDEEKTPEQLLELTLQPEIEIDAITGAKVFHKDRKIKNDSLRNALRLEQRKTKMSFWVKTKYPNPKFKGPQQIQLCINIANKDTNLTYCVNDSICKDPEIKKLLFEKEIGDTTYMVIFIQAYTKSKSDGGTCNAGKEQKLYFVKWNPKTNVAKWKLKNINSCIKTITNMTKEKITAWDTSTILKVSYHRGSKFYDIQFDPNKPQLGFQSATDEE